MVTTQIEEDVTGRLSSEDREKLIVDHLPLVKHVAHRIAARLPATVEMVDLVNAGVLGLLDAVDKFETSRGVKFKTYAELRIRGAILDSLRDLDWAPRSLRRRGRDMEKVQCDLQQMHGRAVSHEEMSGAMGESLDEFHTLLDQLHGLTVTSLEDSFQRDSVDGLIDYYPDDGSTNPLLRFEVAEVTALLAQAIQSLPHKQRLVLSLYYYEEFTMKEVGSVLGVNESRVSQLHSKATSVLRSKLNHAVPDIESALQLLRN